MFGRRILAAAAFVAAVSAQLTITNPSQSSWWVQGSVNTLSWTCDTSPYQSFNVIVDNSNSSILTADLALLADIANYDCSYTIDQQHSSLTPSDTWTLKLTDVANISNVYTSTPFSVKPFGSTYPATSSAASGTSTSTAGSSSSTSTSNKNGAAANYIPVGMSMAAAIALGLVVA